MTTAEYEIRYLRAGIEIGEKYLLAKDIYWPAGIRAPWGEPPYPQLTLGGLLLAQKRAAALEKTQLQQAELDDLSVQLDALRSRWRTAWGKKASAEFRARLVLWRDFLEEYRQQPAANSDRYAYEVGRRVMLDLLQEDALDLHPTQVELLDGLDLWLKAILVKGDFVWDAALQDSFPAAKYWYLYGRLREDENE
ncbi:MAG: hypothetical protein JXB15_04165 [Anaerolineales bacterium]|nr:hypothetical protein [Anaerolineales bacterium]